MWRRFSVLVSFSKTAIWMNSINVSYKIKYLKKFYSKWIMMNNQYEILLRIINCNSQLKAISLKSRPFDSYCWIKVKGHVHSIEKVLEIYQGTLPSIHQVLITAFNNISAVYEKMGDHSKTFEGLREVLSSNHIKI